MGGGFRSAGDRSVTFLVDVIADLTVRLTLNFFKFFGIGKVFGGGGGCVERRARVRLGGTLRGSRLG